MFSELELSNVPALPLAVKRLRASSGASTVVTALVVAVVILAASTAYFGYLALQPGSKTSNGGPTTGSSFPASSSNGLAATGSSDDSTPANSISVSGTAETSYTPNEALLSVSVVMTNKTAVATTQTDAVVTERVIKALNAAGISNSSIQTAGYSLSPNYSNCDYSGCVPSILSFTVTNSLQVNLTSSDPHQLGLATGSAIDTAVGAGANQVSLQFTATNSLLSSLNTQALQQAVASASAQAKVIAASLGVSVTGVISATESYSYSPYQQGIYGSFTAAALPAASSVTPVMPGTQTIYASVQVVYSIS